MTSLARYLGLDSLIPGAGLLNGVTALAQVPAIAQDALHFASREKPLIRQLENALKAFQQALIGGDPGEIQLAAKEAHVKLELILGDRDNYKENFKNYSYMKYWDTYLNPLIELKKEMTAFLLPNFGQTPDQMAAALPAALKLVQAEVQKQKGYVARGVEAAYDALATKAQETANHYLKGDTESGLENPKNLPPLFKMQRLIAHHTAYSQDSIPEVMEDGLKTALHELDNSSPLFKGIEAAVLEKVGPKLTPLAVKGAITAFLFEIASTHPSPELHRYIYLVARERNEVPPRRITEEVSAQEQWGKDFLEDFEADLQDEGVSDAETQVLWTALVNFDEVAKLSKVMHDLEDHSSKSLRSLSDKVDLALAFFENNPYTSSRVMEHLSTTMLDWLGMTYNLAKPHLEKEDRAKLGHLLSKAKHQIQQGRPVEALKLLKKGFETQALAKHMGEMHSPSRPQSAIAQMVGNFEEKSQIRAPHEKPKDWQREFNLQKEQLIDNLTTFSTFKVMETVCGDFTPAESEQVFARVHKQIASLSGVQREERFKELLKEEIDNRPQMGFFSKIYAKLVVSFVYNSVHYFAKHFTTSLTEHLSSLVRRPHENPLGTDHLTPIQHLNNALVAYIQAEARFDADPQGREAGGVGKTRRMQHFLEHPELNGGFEAKELINKVVDKAIKEFLHLKKLSLVASNWNERLVEIRSEATSLPGKLFKGAGTYLLQIPLQLVIRPLFWILDKAYSGTMKQGSSFLLSKLDIVNTVLDTANKTLYEDAQYTSTIDGVILEQLQALEKLLEQEGGDLRLYEGDQGKRLFEELTNNLFTVLDKRGNLTPQQEQRRDTLITQTKEALEDLADEKLKQTVKDLLIFVYQTLRTEDQMSATVITLLKKTNEALLPPKHPIQELYTEKEKAALAMQMGLESEEPSDQDLIIYFALFESGKIPQSEIDRQKRGIRPVLGHEPTPGDLVLHFRLQPEILEKITRTDLDEALKRKYKNTEDEIRAILNRILKKSVEDVVISQAEMLLTSPENAQTHYLTWMENQFIPRQAALQSTQPSYVQTMRQLIADLAKAPEGPSQEGQLEVVRKAHLHMMREMQRGLEMIASKEHTSATLDRRAQSIYEMSEEIFPILQTLSEQLLEYQATKNEALIFSMYNTLKALEETVEKRASWIQGMKHALQRDDGSLGQKVRKWKDWAIQEAAQPCLEHVTNYVHGRLNKRAQEGVHMYKDPNTLPLVIRHVVGLGYLHKKPKPEMGDRPLLVERSASRIADDCVIL